MDDEFKVGKVSQTTKVSRMAWLPILQWETINSRRKMPVLMQHDGLDPIIEIYYCVWRY